MSGGGGRYALAPAELRFVIDSVRVIVCLGGFAWQTLFPVLAAASYRLPRLRPVVAHAAGVPLPRPVDATVSGDVLLAQLLPPEPAEHLHRPCHPDMLDTIFTRDRSYGSR